MTGKVHMVLEDGSRFEYHFESGPQAVAIVNFNDRLQNYRTENVIVHWDDGRLDTMKRFMPTRKFMFV